MRVVHCKRERYTHYIGRPSPLGNPFAIKPSGYPTTQVKSVGEALERFEAHARKHLMNAIAQLPGDAVLGCWCSPGPCHGDVIVKLWSEIHGRNGCEVVSK